MELKMEPRIMEIAERIRTLRDITGFTEAEMAELIGIAEDEYKDFEAGKNDFTFTFLYKCAEKFGVDMIELLTGEKPYLTGYSIIRGGYGLPIKRGRGFEYYHLAARFRDKFAEPFLVKAPYREEEQTASIEMNQHKGQEFNYILSGRLRYVFEDHVEELGAGDSVYYDSGRNHGMIAVGGEDCVFLAMVLKDPEEGE